MQEQPVTAIYSFRLFVVNAVMQPICKQKGAKRHSCAQGWCKNQQHYRVVPWSSFKRVITTLRWLWLYRV